MNIDVTDKKEQRKFGIVMAAAFCVLAGVRWLITGRLALWLFYVAIPFFILGLVAPRVLRPVLSIWMKFALALNWVMTRVLLTIAFFFVLLPTALILRVLGKDPLNRSWKPGAATYWEDAEPQSRKIRPYYKQF